MKRLLYANRSLFALVIGLWPVQAIAGEALHVAALRTQRVGSITYFQVSLTRPRDMRLPVFSASQVGTEAYKVALARMPRLIPQDGKAFLVYLETDVSRGDPRLLQLSGDTLQFVGRLKAVDKARFLLIYPVDKTAQIGGKPADATSQANSETVECTLDFPGTVHAPAPKEETAGGRNRPLDPDDLQRLWATGQAVRFAMLEAQSPDFGFFPFAREATSRKYGVTAPTLVVRQSSAAAESRRRLYEMTTGAVAIAESLQLQHVLSPSFRDRGERTIPIASVSGVRLAPHPWEKMMGGKKPAPEPLARLVPHDQLYLHFKDASRFIDLIDMFEKWGNVLVNVFEINSREYDLRNRYDRQLCFRSRGLAKFFASLVIRELVVTSSDLFIRDGTDSTMILRVVDRKRFLFTVQPYIDEARKEFGKELRETTSVYRDIQIESFVSPLREISMYRAFLKDDLVVVSNSPVAIRRVLDTYRGQYPAIADSPDFRYMRTVFRHDNPQEDGFLFLSEAFIRGQVSPAMKIKQKRRLEGLIGMYLVARAALFSAWEEGRPPGDMKTLLTSSRLRPDDIAVPDGKTIAWDARHELPISDAYNTMQFATPLIEMPIDYVTPMEEREYNAFHEEYRRRWGDYLDPIGIRFTLGAKNVRLETLILPLVNNSWYDALRLWTGNGTIVVRPSDIARNRLVQYRAHLNAALFDETVGKGATAVHRKSSLGNWFALTIDDSAAFGDLVKLLIRREMEPRATDDLTREAGRLFFRVPLTAGVAVGDRKAFQRQLDDYEDILKWLIGDFTVEKRRPYYRGIPITKVRFASDSRVAELFGVNRNARSLPLFQPVLYHALIGDGWYVSCRESCLKDLIDSSIARAKPQRPEKPEDLNGSLYIAPAAAVKGGAALRMFLEWESQRRALANGPEWHTLARCGLIEPAMSEAQKFTAAMRTFAYVPVSPERAAYRYDVKTDEVDNARHGSFRRPILHSEPGPLSPISQLLAEFRTSRTDFIFHEDGIKTVVTLDRKSK